jgi:hypothetical protein
LRQLEKETSLTLPPLRDFSKYTDQKKRFMASITNRIKPDAKHRESLSAVLQGISELKRSGIVLHSYLGSLQDDPWRGYLVFRESGANQVLLHLNKLPLASHLNFEVNELDSPLTKSDQGRSI